MRAERAKSQIGANLAAVGAFVLVFVVLLIIALMNAPVRAVSEVTSSVGNYLAEVRKTAMPFAIVVSIAAAALGVVAAVVVRREWPDLRRRRS